MKKNGLFALGLCGMMLMGNTISAGAVYESSEDIAFAIRPINTTENYLCEDIEDGKTIYINQDDLGEDSSLHFGLFIEAETQQMDVVELRLQTDSENVTFDEETFISPSKICYETAQTFTLPDGTTFSTQLKPYCLGTVGMNGIYNVNGMFMNSFNDTQIAFNMNLMLMSSTHQFLGGKSDLFSLLDLDVKLNPNIEVGTYRIGFVEPTEERKKPNFVSFDIADHSNGEGSKYVDTIPTLKGCNICIGKKGDIDRDGRISADDATAILIYAAESGTGENARFTENGSEAEENFVYSLASLSGDTPSAVDAANILVYSAMQGAGETPDWNQIISQN